MLGAGTNPSTLEQKQPALTKLLKKNRLNRPRQRSRFLVVFGNVICSTSNTFLPVLHPFLQLVSEAGSMAGLKLPCLGCGTHPSTLEQIRIQIRQLWNAPRQRSRPILGAAPSPSETRSAQSRPLPETSPGVGFGVWGGAPHGGLRMFRYPRTVGRTRPNLHRIRP